MFKLETGIDRERVITLEKKSRFTPIYWQKYILQDDGELKVLLLFGVIPIYKHFTCRLQEPSLIQKNNLS
jgi:hypothetical protein